MDTFFEIINNKKIVIDDNFQYLRFDNVLDLSNGALAPDSMSHFDSSYSIAYYFRTLLYSSLEKWMVIDGGPFMSRSTYRRYMAYIKTVTPNNIYGIRFKKQSNATKKVYVRMCYSGLGAVLKKDNTVNSILIEIATNDSGSLGDAKAYRDYFDIVEIGLDKEQIPICKCGIEIYSRDGNPLWNSNCRIVNVLNSYSGDIAGSVIDADWNEKKILIPQKTIRRNSMWYSGHLSRTHSAMYRDFYLYDSNGLTNTVLTFMGNAGHRNYVKDKCHVWDPKEFGSDGNYISGIIAQYRY